MTFPYTGTGGLFTRLGGIGGILNSLEAFVGTGNLSAAGYESIGSGVDKVAGLFATPDLNLINQLYPSRDSYRGVHTSFLSYLQQLSQSVLIQMVNEYAPLPQQTLAAAMQWLANQMTTDAQSVSKPAITATPAANAANTGKGLVTATVLGTNGLQQDYIQFNETIKFSCSSDAQTGGATAGQERFTALGAGAESNALMWDWPLGSGLSGSLSAVDALQNNSGGQKLQNGAGQTWTSPSTGPDNWLILTGTAGTQLVQATGSNVYKGNSGFSFVGDAGNTLTAITQAFGATPVSSGNAGGTQATLTPNTQYALNLFLKVSSVPAAGALAIDLTDGSNNILNDAAGNPNTLSIALTAATTGFVAYNAFFRTPAVVPSSGYRLRVRLSTALTSGVSAYFGHIGFSPATQLYPGGPFVQLWSGYPNFIANDSLTLTTANTYASKWALLLDRLFGMRSLGLQLPSSATPTIADSLIV